MDLDLETNVSSSTPTGTGTGAMPVSEICQTPSPRPTVPPKPKTKEEKEPHGKSGTKSTVGTQVNSVRKTSPGGKNSGPGSFTPGTRNGTGEEGSLCPNNGDVIESFKTSPTFGSDRSRSLSAATGIKPALPPKPNTSALLSPRRGTIPQPGSSPDSKKGKLTSPISSSSTPHSDISLSPRSPTNWNNPFSPRTDFGNSVAQHVSNLNQSQRQNTNTTNKVVQLRTVQNPFVPWTEIQKSEARKKTTSLGRNFDFSTVSGLGRNPTQQFFTASPLDLHSSTSRPRSMDHFGRSISFAPNSPLPPPPPPRIKRKFSSTSPTTATLPESPPLIPSSPPPVYAKIDKEKKWEMRRLSENLKNTAQIISEGTLEGQTSAETLIADEQQQPGQPDESQDLKLNSSQNKISETQVPVVNSWLGKLLEKSGDSVDSVCDAGQNKEEENSETVPEPEQLNTSLGLDQGKSEERGGENSIQVEEELSPTDEPGKSSFLFSHIGKSKPNPIGSEFVSPDSTKTDFDVFSPEEEKPESEIISDQSTLVSEVTTPQDSVTPLVTVSPQSLTPGPTRRRSSDDSFEKVCERKLESLEINGNTNSNQTTPQLDLNLEAGKLLESVDSKIQTLQSLLSTISCSSSAEGNMNQVQVNHNGNKSTTPTDPEIEIGSKTDADLVNEIISQKFTPQKLGSRGESPARGVIKIETTPPPPNTEPRLINRDSFRRRSWNCSEHTSTPTSGSSASSSSSSIRDRTGSMAHASGWLDAGDISTGALGDTENSDVSTQIVGPGSLRPYPGSGGSLSRRKRTTVSSIFSSFGKGMGSSSGSNSNSPSAPKPKRKEKSRLFSSDSTGSAHKKGLDTQHRVSNAIFSVTTNQLSHWPGGGAGDVGIKPKKTVSLPQFNHPSSDDLYRSKQVSSGGHGAGRYSTASGHNGDDDDGERADVCSIASNASIYDDILAELSPKEKKAFYVARELLTSERTFVDVLNLLTIDFPNYLREAGEMNRQPVISDADLHGILGELPTLKSVNIILLGELEERIRGWKSNPKVADIIVKTGPFLKHYSTYIKNFEKMSHFLAECRQKNAKFCKALMDFEMSVRCQKLGLMHYMLKPVQRMPQYPLLLEDYLKNLDQDSADFKDTVKAITIVREVAEHANEAIRLQVNADKLINLQNRLSHSVILKPDRQLIKEGELQKVCRKELQPRYFGLMNDCLLCFTYNYNATSGTNRDLKARYELPLTGMQVLLSSSEDYANEFTVISTTRSFNLLARSSKEREEWMKALNLAIRDNIKKRSCSTPDMDKEFELGKVAPVWIQDSRVTMCQVCTAEFTIYFRRHHCRACGKVVCRNCSGNEAPLHYQHLESARVCDDCYQFLLEEFDKENQQNDSGDIDVIRMRFKKATPKVTGRTTKRTVPTRLEVNPNGGSQVSGYLAWRERRSWKRRWFVLVDRVLLVCAASEDVVASKSIPILGYDVEVGTEKTYEGVDGHLVFKLTHSGQSPIIFQAENESSLEKWVSAMREATILT